LAIFNLHTVVLTWLSHGSFPNELFLQNLLGIKKL
jgi:hypothetical protein